MDYLDRLPVNVLIADAIELKITYVNKCFEDQIMGKMQAVGMKFLLDFLKCEEDRYKFECAISILQREVSRDDSVEVGAFQTLCLYGKERFPLYSSFLWSVTKLLDGKIMFSAPKIAMANDNDTSTESSNNNNTTTSSILTTNEFVDFFQQAPIALHWLSGTGHNK
jgi:hypothetical protein